MLGISGAKLRLFAGFFEKSLIMYLAGIKQQEDDDEFDMFAQTRNSTFADSRRA